jgi:hypothetical protein
MINFFVFISQFTIVSARAYSKLQKIYPSAIDKSLFRLWQFKNVKIEAFFKHHHCAIYKCMEHSLRLLQATNDG